MSATESERVGAGDKKYGGLRVRILADTRGGERVRRYDPDTGEPYLYNPATGRAEGWPRLGVMADGDLPKYAVIPTSFVERGIAQGWITVDVGDRPMGGFVKRPGGPPGNPWLVDAAKGIPHEFRHADAITLHLFDGDARYVVTHQPDKYHDGPAGTDAVGDPTARVDHFYLAELEEV